jgi:hypothetical protein
MVAVVADNVQTTAEADPAALARRLALARKAYRDFYAQCFWSYREVAEITDEKIPFVVRRLREHGGHAGYRIAAQLTKRSGARFARLQ